MLNLARELLAQHPGRLVAIGVSFGGPVDAGRGVVRLSHHVPGWEETPLRDRLQAELGAPVAVDNDANVAALGEWRFGAGQGCDSVFYVTVSTGVGGGWVLGGRIWSGADGMAGEIGHNVVRPGGVPCVCGKAGCVEAEACGWGIAAKARRHLEAGSSKLETGSALMGLAGGKPDAVTAQMVAQAAAEGDALAQELLYGAAEALGMGIGAALNLMNPRARRSGRRHHQVGRALVADRPRDGPCPRAAPNQRRDRPRGNGRRRAALGRGRVGRIADSRLSADLEKGRAGDWGLGDRSTPPPPISQCTNLPISQP